MRHHDILDCLGFPSVNPNGGHSRHVLWPHLGLHYEKKKALGPWPMGFVMVSLKKVRLYKVPCYLFYGPIQV
jgi:hypothetical protein